MESEKFENAESAEWLHRHGFVTQAQGGPEVKDGPYDYKVIIQRVSVQGLPSNSTEKYTEVSVEDFPGYDFLGCFFTNFQSYRFPLMYWPEPRRYTEQSSGQKRIAVQIANLAGRHRDDASVEVTIVLGKRV